MFLTLRLINRSLPSSLPFIGFGRGRQTTAKRSLPQVRRTAPAGRQKILVSRYPDFRPVEDRRTFHPEGSYRPVRSINGNRVGVQPVTRKPQARAGIYPTSALGFINPARVLICVRRQRRKQVLHALGLAGGRGFKPPKFNWTSGFSC